jgi:hypothetical protein
MTFRTKDLRLHRRKVLFEREKTVLPTLQIYVEYKKDGERLAKEIIDLEELVGRENYQDPVNKTKLAYRWRKTHTENARIHHMIQIRRTEITVLKGHIQNRPPETHLEFVTRLNAARKERDEYKAQRSVIEPLLDKLNAEYSVHRVKLGEMRRDSMIAAANYEDRGSAVPTQRREFIMKCPAEDCRGFLSSAYKCGTCESWACKDCIGCIGKDANVEHTCNPDTVESAKTIRAETRPCPKCATRIFKIDGCDQMWCVMEGCGTAFSWNTGHIVVGVVHNPHYYEWLRRQAGAATVAREVGDIPCGGMPHTWQFVSAIHHLTIPNEIKGSLLETFRNMQELIEHRIGTFPARIPQLMNKEDDVAYLMNRLTGDEWKRKLEISEARFNRKKEIGQILQTLVTAGSDMMNRLYDRAKSIPPDDTIDVFVNWLLDVCIPEFEQLRKFGNDALCALAKRDKMAVPQFEGDWRWKGIRALYKKTPVVEAVTEIV